MLLIYTINFFDNKLDDWSTKWSGITYAALGINWSAEQWHREDICFGTEKNCTVSQSNFWKDLQWDTEFVVRKIALQEESVPK